MTPMSEAAAALASLPGAGLAFGDERRREWTYLPGARHGVALGAMERTSSKTTMRLLAEGLSAGAYAQAVTIMAIEDVLDVTEGGTRERHRGDYWLAVYGDPTATGEPWGWRLEGHHLSVNWTCVDATVIGVTPLFMGANPARTVDGGRTVVAPLAPEEDAALALLDALDIDQRRVAELPGSVPADILTRDAAALDDLPPSEGIRLGDLGGAAAQLAADLVERYRRRPSRWPDASQRAADVGDARFVWIGGAEPGQPHYYRIQGRRLLIEFDNTQNGANHVHTVMRDPGGDFGGDALRAHRRAAH